MNRNVDTPSGAAPIIAYHEATKHHFNRFARSLGYMDWDTQPDPFRTYLGAPSIELPFGGRVPARPFEAVYGLEADNPSPLTLNTFARFLRHALGLSAWKEYGPSRWSLRANPSSGNLHPTEAYAAIPTLPDLGNPPALVHYGPGNHQLEFRAHLPDACWKALAGGLPDGGFFAGTASIQWRESWKYGERAFRYCLHDTGHALAAMAFSAELEGWTLKLLPGWSSGDMATLSGLDRLDEFHENEREEPEWIAAVVPRPDSSRTPAAPPDAWRERRGETQWFGFANRLSPEHHPWEIIEEAERITRNPGGTAELFRPLFGTEIVRGLKPTGREARRTILQRRSALGFEAGGELPLEDFVRMMTRTLPGPWAPWTSQTWTPRAHLALFVHRVESLAPGLYALVRDPARFETLRSACDSRFEWKRPDAVPAGLPLYRLMEMDVQGHARAFSCHQDIASDGFFSLGMLAEFAAPLETRGPWMYRNLFWETGMIGQVLYLEAEASGVRATGIGCFFDDAVHQALELTDNRFQSLYHFTVGKHVDDPRLATRKPYEREEFLENIEPL